MKFSAWNRLLLLPEKEIILNRTFSLQGNKALLAGFTLAEDEAKLWLFVSQQHHDEFDNLHLSELAERLAQKLEISRQNGNPSSIFVGEQKFAFHTIKRHRFYEPYYQGFGYFYETDFCAALEHFLLRGMDFSLFDEVGIDDIEAYTFIATRSEYPRSLATDLPEITLCFDRSETEEIVVHDTA